MDLDPFEPVGIAASTMRFIDMFLLHCLLSDSADDSPHEIAALARNQQRVAAGGRVPGLLLERGDGEVSLAEWGTQLLRDMAPIADAMDAAHAGADHRNALAAAQASLSDLQATPSARVLATMARDFDSSFVAFTRAQSVQTRNALLALPFSAEQQARFIAMTKASVDEQKRIEANDSLPFEQYRQQYLSVERLGVPGLRKASRN